MLVSPSSAASNSEGTRSDQPGVIGSVKVNNNAPYSTGEYQVSLNRIIENPTQRLDQIELFSDFTLGSSHLHFSYDIPYGDNGLFVGTHASWMQYWIINEPSFSNSAGEASNIGLHTRYPLLRDNTNSLTVSSTLDRNYYLNSKNAKIASDKTVNILNFGLSGDRIDTWGEGGISFASVFLKLGQLDLSGNAADLATDQSSAKKDGIFGKILWKAQRLQKLNETTQLWLSINGQLASKNLDSSESFLLGGPAGVRAYPGMEGAGDAGWLLSVEVRKTLQPKLILAGFYDHGYVAQHTNNWSGWNASNTSQPSAYSLKGSGVSLTWNEKGNYSAKIVYAHRLGDNPLAEVGTGNDADNSHVLNRLWLNYEKYW
ncbi:MAG: ShlB/FhaC/HecB family hemolysin secretion/activation protein [Gallionellaceae bacterium]